MRFKISLHIDKITDCDNSAAGNGNTFCPGICGFMVTTFCAR